MRIRSVSPLIATIILIALTVAIGAIIVGWGRSYIQKQTICLDVSLEILSVTYNLSSSLIYTVTFINSGSVKIPQNEKLYIIVEDIIGNRDTKSITIGKDIDPGESYTANFNLQLSNVKQKPYKVWIFLGICPDRTSDVYTIM